MNLIIHKKEAYIVKNCSIRRKTGVYPGLRTCGLFLSFEAIVFLLYLVLGSLFSHRVYLSRTQLSEISGDDVTDSHIGKVYPEQ